MLLILKRILLKVNELRERAKARFNLTLQNNIHNMNRYFPFFIIILFTIGCTNSQQKDSETITDIDVIEISYDTLLDKVRGGLLGQIIGNLNGLPHEFKYD